MRFNVKYIGAGGEVDMSTAPILYREHDFMKREHNYSATALVSGLGSKLARFYREARVHNSVIRLGCEHARHAE